MSIIHAIIIGNLIAACFNLSMIGRDVPEWVLYAFWPLAITTVYAVGNLA